MDTILSDDKAALLNKTNEYPANYCAWLCFTNLLNIVIGLLAFAINITVVSIALLQRQIREKSNQLLINLLFCDMIMGVTYMIRGVIRESQRCPIGMRNVRSCLLENGPVWAAIDLALCATVLVTVGRFIAVKFPFWHHKQSKRLEYWLILICWSLFIAISCIRFTSAINSDNNDVLVCKTTYLFAKWYYYFTHYSQVLAMLIIFTLYIALCVYLHRWKHYRSLNSIYMSDVSISKNSQASTLIITIITVYLLLWVLPIIVLLITMALLKHRYFWESELIRLGVSELSCLTSITNAIIFTWKSPELRNYILTQYHGLSARNNAGCSTFRRSHSSFTSSRSNLSSIYSGSQANLHKVPPRGGQAEIDNVTKPISNSENLRPPDQQTVPVNRLAQTPYFITKIVIDD